jgi:hypothetical protein
MGLVLCYKKASLFGSQAGVGAPVAAQREQKGLVDILQVVMDEIADVSSGTGHEARRSDATC